MARRRASRRTTTDVALEIIGDLELVANLTLLGRSEGGRIARRAVNKGLQPIVQEMKTGLPPVKSTRRVRKGKSGRRRAKHSNVKTRRSIGKRFRKNRRRGTIEAKAGFKVGKKRRDELAHVHLRFTGTKERTRYRSRRGRTGSVEPVIRRYAAQAADRASQKSMSAIRDTVKDGLEEFFEKKR